MTNHEIQCLEGSYTMSSRAVLPHAHLGSPSSRLRAPRASGDRNQTPETRLLVKFRTFRVQSWLFEVIPYSFGIIFGQKTQEHIKPIKKCCLDAKNENFHKNILKNMFSWRMSLEGFPGGIPCLISCEKC